MDFAEDYRKKVTSVTISADQSGETEGDIGDVLVGYRIVPREDKEENKEEDQEENKGEDKNESYENGGSNPAKFLNILLPFFTALVTARGFMRF